MEIDERWEDDFYIRICNGKRIESFNAKYYRIVACNSHDELLEALEELVKTVNHTQSKFEDFLKSSDKAKSAIAKAKGGAA